MAKVKITNSKMQTQQGPARRPSSENDTHAHVLTAREIAEYARKRKKKKKES